MRSPGARKVVLPNLDDFIKDIKIFRKGPNIYGVAVHVYYWIDIFALDKKKCLHLLHQSCSVSQDWIGSILLEQTEWPNIRKIILVAQQLYQTFDLIIN